MRERPAQCALPTKSAIAVSPSAPAPQSVAFCLLLLFSLFLTQRAGASAQWIASGGTRAVASYHGLGSKPSLGTDLTARGLFVDFVSPAGLGLTAGLDRNRLGISCLAGGCPTSSWTGWAGVVGMVPLGPIAWRPQASVGLTSWSGSKHSASAVGLGVRFPSGRTIQGEVSVLRIALPPLDPETGLALSVWWVFDPG